MALKSARRGGIRFTVTGNTHNKVAEWVKTIDLMVIRYRIEKHGSALIVSFKGQRGMTTITEMPELGEAVPHYSDINDAFSYTFSPHEDDCSLQIVAEFSGKPPFVAIKDFGDKLHVITEFSGKSPFLTYEGYDRVTIDDLPAEFLDVFPKEPIPPLVFHHDSNINVEQWNNLNARIKILPDPARGIFTIMDDIYHVLRRTGWRPKMLTSYRYKFVPSGIGEFIDVENKVTSETFDITKDVNW